MTLAATIAAVKADGKSRQTTCPAHEDGKASLNVSPGDKQPVVLFCHAQCTTAAVLDAAGLTVADISTPKTSTTKPAKREIVATYEYGDEQNDVLYEVVRYEPKDFRQRKPDGKGGYIWQLGAVRRVVYRLSEVRRRLSAEESRTHRRDHGLPDVVFLPEGEKDVDRLVSRGLIATCNVGGAGKWRPEYTQQLVDAGARSVIVLPDNDEPGRQHAIQVQACCLAAGLDVKIVALPDLPPKGDVSDYLKTHTLAELVAVATAVPATETMKPLTDLSEVLKAVETFIRKFVVVTDQQSALLALWTAHTHAIDAADCTGYLQVTSVTPEAGKTRLLETMEVVVARPWFTGRTSAAALVRKVDQDAPTLLLDESDATFNGEPEYAEALRGILNSGYRRSGRTTLCIGQGANLTFRDFSTFGPKAIAGIGKLPDTVASRAIRIELKRRTKDEPAAKFRERDARIEAEPIVSALVAWASQHTDGLRGQRPAMPQGLRDRSEDVLEPLFAIADLAGGTWPDRARRAAVTLMGTVPNGDINIELLHDIRRIFEDEHATFLPSKTLIDKLVSLEDQPWAEWSKGKPMSQRAMADRLKGFGIIPGSNGEKRGYLRDRFTDAWTRYPKPATASHPYDPGSEVSNRQDPNVYGPEPAISKCQDTPSIDTLKIDKSPTNTGPFDGLTVCKPDHGNQGVDDDTNEVGNGVL